MCPVCQEPLVAFELQGVEIDRCTVCGGVWLDAGELELIAEMAGVEPGGLGRVLSEAKGRRAPRRCPRCSRRLEVVPVGANAATEIDRCPAGDGLWFDDREMQAFLERFHEGEEGAVAGFFADFFGKKSSWNPADRAKGK